MKQKPNSTIRAILEERFGHDTLLSVATTDGNTPYVRIVNACGADGNTSPRLCIVVHERARQ